MAGVIDASKMPSALEVKRTAADAPAERGGRGRHCRLHAEHFARSPDVTGARRDDYEPPSSTQWK